MKIRKHLKKKPLHVQAAEVLREEILTRCQPGQKLESESRMAEQLGVSLLTLRHAVGALAHEGLVERRQGSGTYVADFSAKRHVAIVNRADPSIHGSAFQLRIYHLLGAIFHARGYRHRFYVWGDGTDGGRDFKEDASHGSVCGVVFVAMHADPALPILREKRIPFVDTAGGATSGGMAMDWPKMVRDGARHLLERGCRKIALMQWSYSLPAERCIEALRSALSDYGVPLEEGWIRQTVSPDAPGAGWEQFREIWSAKSEKPDGLIVTDDVLFRDVALGILDSGIKVPDQLQVVTHANKGSGIHYPFPVAKLEIDPQEYAEALADGLIRFMKHEDATAPMRYIQARLLPAGAAPDQPEPVLAHRPDHIELSNVPNR